VSSLVDRSVAVARKLARSPAKPPTVIEFDRGRVSGETGQARELRPKLDYFQVRVNELFLSYERRWGSEYDPMVYVLSEFQYGSDAQPMAVPFIVGPQLVNAGAQAPPGNGGMVLTDTRVAGPHPYHGKLALTVALCEIERVNYARAVLSAIEQVAGAFDFAAAVAPYLKVASIVVDGVDSLFGDDGPASSLALNRTELEARAEIEAPLYIALIAQSDVDQSELWVSNRRLVKGRSADEGVPYRDGDFVLYSLLADVERHDVDTLPFQHLWQLTRDESQRAINDALWERAKAILFSLAEAVRASPDLTSDHAERLIEQYTERALLFRDKARRMSALSGDGAVLSEGERRTSAILGL
jgi:hypothetical protein